MPGSSFTGCATLTKISLVSWTIYSWTQQTRQVTFIIPSLLPLWAYRVSKRDYTALTDVILYSALHVLLNGLPTSQDVLGQLLPLWLVEERLMELQIFAMTAVMALFAGLIAYRGEDTKIQHGSRDFFTISFLLVSTVSGLWFYNVRTVQDLYRLTLPQWVIEERPMELKFFSLVILLALMAGIIAWRGEDKPHVRFAETPNNSLQKVLLPPLLIPGRTSQTRSSPKEHSFEYPYLAVGVPVGWMGCAGSALSCDIDHLDHISHGSSMRPRGWLDISAKDYLSRDGHDCLEHKLRHYLRQQVSFMPRLHWYSVSAILIAWSSSVVCRMVVNPRVAQSSFKLFV